MGKVNLIDQLRKHGTGGDTTSSKSYHREAEVEFEESGGSGSTLDAYEKRKVFMLVLGVFLVLAGRQAVPYYVADQEAAVRAETAELDQKIAAEQQKSQGMKMVEEEMRQYDSRVADLKAKLQKVQLLDEDRNLLVRMTDYIVKEMPTRLWFDKIDIDTRSKVDISGYSSNYQIVSDFMKKLDGAIYFPQWKLVQTENQSTPATGAPATTASSVEVPAGSKRFQLEAEAAHL